MGMQADVETIPTCIRAKILKKHLKSDDYRTSWIPFSCSKI